MGTRQGRGKGRLVRELMAKEHYSWNKAMRLVDTVINVIGDYIRAGKNVEIEGLGVLSIMPAKKTPRKIVKGMNGHPAVTIMSGTKRTKRIALKKHIVWKGDEENE